MFTVIFGRISPFKPIVCVSDPIMRGFAMDSSASLLSSSECLQFVPCIRIFFLCMEQTGVIAWYNDTAWKIPDDSIWPFSMLGVRDPLYNETHTYYIPLASGAHFSEIWRHWPEIWDVSCACFLLNFLVLSFYIHFSFKTIIFSEKLCCM